MTSVVLYVEDDEEDVLIFQELLNDIDPSIKYLHAKNGKEALTLLGELVIQPDYIFLDINMPVMDGQGFLTEVKKDARFHNIPVVMYTTSTRPDDKKLFESLGAKDYVVKPSSYFDAREGIGKLISKFRA
jgi:CheY-like chemotaxis protein